MTKENAINIIDKVRLADYNEFTIEELFIIRRYVELMKVFDYKSIIGFIDSRKNQQRKIGGRYIDFHKAIAYLKQELKQFKKHE